MNYDMKQLKYIIAMCGLLLTVAACTDQHTPEVGQTGEADNWVLSRSAESNIPDIRMTGKSTGKGKDFSQKITFGTGGEGTWDENPEWNDGDIFDLIAFYPAGEGMPENDIISSDAQMAYQMQYWAECTKTNRPNTFQLKHLMGQLKVHVTIEELKEEHHEPLDVNIMLCKQATVNYRNGKAEAIAGSADWVQVAGFVREQVSQDGAAAQSGEAEQHKWVMENAVYIIPQTIPADRLGAIFWVKDPVYGDAHYEFYPPAPITLAAGKITHLYLGVVYSHENGEDDPSTPAFNVVDFEVKVTDWAEGTDNSGNATLQ